jgi:hypothetical protein
MSVKALLCALLLASIAVVPGALGQDNVRIGELSYLDLQYMAQQRETLSELVERNLGRQFNGSRDNDLELLQLLLDRRLVRPDQTQELQAMGVIMGDLHMHWVVYEDSLGRSRALRYRETDNYLFPMTMISRRREADNRTPVEEIYQKAYDIIAPLRPDMPFQ